MKLILLLFLLIVCFFREVDLALIVADCLLLLLYPVLCFSCEVVIVVRCLLFFREVDIVVIVFDCFLLLLFFRAAFFL